jgi:chitinase
VSVDYATVNGTATAPGDYSARSGTMIFAAGQTTKAVLVPSNQDALDEVNETFRLQLSNPVATTIADASGTATIRDDDPSPSRSQD